MGKLSGIELKRARLVPSSVFASPEEVVASAALSRVQKIAILRRWEFDVRSTDSGGVDGQGLMLYQVHQALGALGVAPPALRSPAVTH